MSRMFYWVIMNSLESKLIISWILYMMTCTYVVHTVTYYEAELSTRTSSLKTNILSVVFYRLTMVWIYTCNISRYVTSAMELAEVADYRKPIPPSLSDNSKLQTSLNTLSIVVFMSTLWMALATLSTADLQNLTQSCIFQFPVYWIFFIYI